MIWTSHAKKKPAILMKKFLCSKINTHDHTELPSKSKIYNIKTSLRFHSHLKDFMLEMTRILDIPLSLAKKIAQSGWHTIKLPFLFSSILWLVPHLSWTHTLETSLPHTPKTTCIMLHVQTCYRHGPMSHSRQEHHGITHWELRTPAVEDAALGTPAAPWHRIRHLFLLSNSPRLLWLLVLKLH